ncbi:MAG: hypothetical protein N4A33_10330 [Bacteriovoracaceae bacterium]|jgi:hypothetical protein|nr:hypothetical protein [Bacteriovoracaceae bacterium]
MKKKSLLIVAMCLFSLSCLSQSVDLWNIKDNISDELKVNDLKFTNRARCALDSKLPTKSAFVMIDNVNPAKAIHRFATNANLDIKKEVALSISKFRYTVNSLLELIATKLMNGELPLLESDYYKQVALSCSKNGNCEDLYSHIENLWNDLEKNEKSFVSNRLVKKNTENYSCYYLKKFSPIQSHLFGTKPNASVMNSIGKTVVDSDSYLAKCDDIDAQKDLKVANFQIDLINLNDEVWSKIGFKFWDSLKVYFSWAYRYSKESEQLLFPFEKILKSVAIEETVILIPNGCKSITAPACDAKSLSMNTMRFFAQSSNESSIFQSDVLEQIPMGPEHDLLARPITDVNTDILNLGNYENATKWSSNFRNNFTKARGYIKLKLAKAINNLSVIRNSLTKKDIRSLIEKDLKQIEEVESNEHKQLLTNQFYYMCSEFLVASSEKLSFLRQDFEILEKTDVLNRTVEKLSGQKVQDLFSYYEELAKEVRFKCNKMEAKGVFNQNGKTSREGFHSWYKEQVFQKPHTRKTQTIDELINYQKPVIALKSYNVDKRKSNIICSNGANCVRLYLDSIIDLYAVVQYSNSLIPLTGTIQTPSMLNPMAERTSCGVYDPWYKTKTTIFQFFHDMLSGAMFGLLPSPVYVTGIVDPKKAVSFNKLIEDGKVRFSPEFSKKRIRGALSLDFGFLLGVPCNLSISDGSFDPRSYYAFNGISFNACRRRDRNNLTVMSASDMNSSNSSTKGCFTCAINLQSISGAVSKINPVTRVGYFLARGIYRLYKNLKDPNDIPRSWDANLVNVGHSYRKKGTISKVCARKLRKGKTCLDNSCESSLVTRASTFFTAPVVGTNVRMSRKYAYLKIKGCEQLVKVKLRGNKSRICSSEIMDDFKNYVTVDSACKHLVRKEK